MSEEPKSRMIEEPKNRRTEESQKMAFGSLVLWCFGALILFAPGCHVSRWLRRDSGSPPPVAFAALPSPMEAVSAVNANTQRVQSLQSQGATISIPGAPSIGAEVALARPRQLRVKAGTQLLAPELDLGS